MRRIAIVACALLLAVLILIPRPSVAEISHSAVAAQFANAGFGFRTEPGESRSAREILVAGRGFSNVPQGRVNRLADDESSDGPIVARGRWDYAASAICETLQQPALRSQVSATD